MLHVFAILLQTAPSSGNLIIFAIVKVVLMAGVGLIATELSKINATIQKYGALAVAIVGALWGAIAGFLSGFAHTPVPTDFTQLTATGVVTIITAVLAVVLHINQAAPLARKARLGTKFRF